MGLFFFKRGPFKSSGQWKANPIFTKYKDNSQLYLWRADDCAITWGRGKQERGEENKCEVGGSRLDSRTLSSAAHAPPAHGPREQRPCGAMWLEIRMKCCCVLDIVLSNISGNMYLWRPESDTLALSINQLALSQHLQINSLRSPPSKENNLVLLLYFSPLLFRLEAFFDYKHCY